MQNRTLFLAMLAALLLSTGSLSAQDDIGAEFIPPQAAVAVVIKPNAIYNSPLLQMVPWEVLSVKSQEFSGVAAQNIESALLIASPPGVDGKPEIAVVVKLAEAVDLNNLFPPLREAGELKPQPWNGGDKKYLQGSAQLMFDVYPVDEKTLLLAMPRALQAMLAQQANPVDCPLANLVRSDYQAAEAQAFLVVKPIRELSQFLLSDPKLADFPGLKELPQQLSHAQMIGNLDLEQGGLTLKLTAANESEAEQLEATVQGLLESAAQLANRFTQPTDPESAEGKALRQYSDRIVGTLRTALSPVRTKNQVILTTVGKPGTSPQVVLASGSAFFLPVIAAAQANSYRARSMNNLKQIMLAMHNYYDTHRKMPSDSYDANGKPLLSWRVHILPFVEQAALYNQFHLDEPWDSEHNRKLSSIMPAQYTTPADEQSAAQGKTRYQRPLGEGLPASIAGDLQFQNLTDGTSNTLAVVETPAADAVLWARPGDFNVDLATPTQSLLPGETPGFMAARYDGSVQYFQKKLLTDEQLKALLTHAGGEVVND